MNQVAEGQRRLGTPSWVLIVVIGIGICGWIELRQVFRWDMPSLVVIEVLFGILAGAFCRRIFGLPDKPGAQIARLDENPEER